MKKIITGVLIVLLLLTGIFWYVNYLGEKDLEEYTASLESKNIESSSTEEMLVATTSAATSATTSAVTASVKTYTMAEIALHNQKSDCWMSVNGQVLDVTGFISKHPGGDEILKGCGKDASNYFKKVPGHMKGVAQMLLKKLAIGKLQE